LTNPLVNKLAPYGTDSRLFTTDGIDASAKFSHVIQKLGQLSKIWPDQI